MRIAFTHNLQTVPGEAEAEFDTPETIAMLAASLRRLGHDVTPIEVSGALAPTVELLENAAFDMAFNTAEGSHGRFRESFHPALFERLRLPYVGSSPHVCAVTLDKYLSKTLVAAHGVPTPPSRLVCTEDDLESVDLPFPVIIKPNFEGSSKGISADSVAEDRAGLMRRARRLLADYPDGLLVESYIDGLDVVVPFIEGVSAATGGVLEPASYEYRAGFADRKYTIYDGDMKRSGFDGLSVVCPARVPERTRARLVVLSRHVFRALGVRDLARIDFRVATDGTPYFLEVNALPSLEAGASIYLCGERAGVIGVEAVLEAVLASARRRHGMLRSSKRTNVA